MNTSSFSALPLSAAMLYNLNTLEYREMTPIQAQALPVILAAKDLLAQAKSGSGKTAAFAIGILHKLEARTYQVQALVLCPTRELAEQVGNETRRLARALPNTKITTLCGGKPMGPQLASLEHQPHIVVGTPGRILGHLEKKSLKLEGLKTLVLDEADRMLDMGFHDDIMQIIRMTPRHRQTLLFSATYADEITRISHAIQDRPVEVRVESLHDNQKIRQVFYEIPERERSDTLIGLLRYYRPESCLVFCNTRLKCQELADTLNQSGLHALALHGDLEQRERDQVLVRFANGSCPILIATDVAARGLDIKGLNAVINYELSPDPEVHVHRIGRTGRAAMEGLALSLFTHMERYKVEVIEDFIGSKVCIESPAWLTSPGADSRSGGPVMTTLSINGGRKDKIRPGDILGALTAANGLPGNKIGKIDIYDKLSYVAVASEVTGQALKILSSGKIKGRRFRIQQVN